VQHKNKQGEIFMGVSLKPDTFTQGVLDDVDVTWTECRFVMYDYDGKSPQPAPGLMITMEDDDGKEYKQFYSAGAAKDWAPNPDDGGKTLEAVGKAKALNQNSNVSLLLSSLINAGYDQDEITDDVSDLDGIRAHMIQVPAPKRSGLVTQGSQDKTILVVDSLLESDGQDKGKGRDKDKGKDKGKDKDKGSDSDIENDVTEFVIETISNNDGEVTKKDLAVASIKHFKKGDKKAVNKFLLSEDWLKEGPWDYDGETLKM
jgi:hypothetical protein